MAKILSFTKMKIGEVVKMELRGVLCKCKILEHLGNDVYKIKVLDGVYKGQTATLTMTRWEDDNDSKT